MAEEQLTDSDHWINFWTRHAQAAIQENPQRQVLRTLNKEPIGEAAFQEILADIAGKIEISAADEILDLCCGNGLITRYLAPRCQRIVGVDFVKELAEQITVDAPDNISVIIQDVKQVDFESLSFDKIIIYAALQYFSYAETISLFEAAKRWLKKDGLFYVGDIPNREKLWNFFNSDDREKAYFESEKANKPIIGIWFDPAWLTRLGKYCGFNHTQVLEQSQVLPYSHYRFDLVLRKSEG